MSAIKPICVSGLVLALALVAPSDVAAELTTNGDFETGDTSGWTSFALPAQTFAVTSDSKTGSFAGELFNDVTGSALVIKQANLGVGLVTAGETILISFDAKGGGTNGGVAFAEFFSELAGGGTSSNLILGSGQLALTSDYQRFSFSPVTGPDVGGGITLQFNAATGANIGSTSSLFIDNVSVARISAVPEPASAALAGLISCGILLRRRR
nr:PEP-CTERM sorting domain-containing protein [Rhodopirellula sp. SM50]